jgi:hypothetical protein
MELLLKHSRDGQFELYIEAYRDAFCACIEAVGDEYIRSLSKLRLERKGICSNKNGVKKSFFWIPAFAGMTILHRMTVLHREIK